MISPPVRRTGALRNVVVYLGLALLFIVPVATLFHFAPGWLDLVAVSPVPKTAQGAASGPWGWLADLHKTPAGLLLQIVVVVVTAKCVGAAMHLLGQPRVIGEMFAGILLGPSLFGLATPDLQQLIFAESSLATLKALSLVGVVVFMFGVGLELDTGVLKRHANTALAVSHFSICLPFLLGAGLAIWLYRDYAPANVDVRTFLLFMGIAMSITAFPVLASICRDRGLLGTELGGLALACAAIDDVTAWFLLAGILAFARSESMTGAMITGTAAIAYCVVMLRIIKPRLHQFFVVDNSHPERVTFAVVTLLFVSALVTELIGIHALFGAFLAGVVMSGNAALRRFVQERIEPFITVVLLPIFFCYTGLRTEIGLINDAHGWSVCAIVICVASIGKLGGGAIAARAMGRSQRDSMALGVLMNTRGLMELVVLNIGLDLGLIEPSLFSIMVMMALVTTLLTGPLLALIQAPADRRKTKASAQFRVGRRDESQFDAGIH